MIDLYNGQLTDLLQNGLRNNPDVIAISYAIQAEKQRLLRLEAKTRTLSMIDELDDNILDVLAVELRSPYYTNDMPTEQKRAIIKGTLAWFYHAGTPVAVSEMAAAIFGSGQVVEWFNFDPNDGEIVPGEFDVETGSAIQDPEEYMGQISRIINRVKNTRSHLRMVRFLRMVLNPVAAVVLPQHYSVATASNVIHEAVEPEQPMTVAAFAQADQGVTIRNVVDKTRTLETGPAAAGFTQAVPIVTIHASA